MSITTDSLRADLSGLSGQAERAAKADNDLTRAADERRAHIIARLEELRPQTLTDPGAAEEYQALIAERGQMDATFPS